MESNDVPNPTQQPWLMTVEDVAQRLQVSIRTVWRLRSAGRLPRPLEVGGSVRWKAEAIREWIEGGCPASAARENGLA